MITPPTYNFIKGSYCSYCGSKFAEQILWPRKCFRCNNESYVNPAPVTVALISVLGRGNDINNDMGVLIQRRNIEPKKGAWALPGGYMNLGETWQEGCAREIEEEIGLITDPAGYKMIDIAMGSNNNTLLIFASYYEVIYWDDIHFVPNSEVQEIRLAYTPEELAWPTHTINLQRYLENL
jgi:ADP-ribose pyrophosphatase YjhB (NUDIX family)